MGKIKIEQPHVQRQVMSLLCYSDVSMLYVASQHIQKLVGAFFQIENAAFNDEQDKESIICEDGIEKSVPRNHCLSSASLVMLNSEPRDRFFYPTLTS